MTILIKTALSTFSKTAGIRCCLLGFNRSMTTNFTAAQASEQMYLTLNNGYKMPMIGCGTWPSTNQLYSDATERPSVATAIKKGYRLIDATHAYCQEGPIGKSIQKLVKRDDIFIVMKLPMTIITEEDVVPSLMAHLSSLNLDYVDLYLMEFNSNGGFQKPRNPFVKKNLHFSQHYYVKMWKGMEAAVKMGLARSIGLSNFNHRRIDNVLLGGSIRPAVVQVESNPLSTNRPLIDWCQQHRMQIMTSSPFGNVGSLFVPRGLRFTPSLFNNAQLQAIAAKFPGKTPADVVLRWQIQRGVAVISESVYDGKNMSGGDVFTFELSEKDMDAVYSISEAHTCHDYALFQHKLAALLRSRFYEALEENEDRLAVAIN